MNFGELGEGYALVLRTADRVTEMHDLTLKNLDRLREWEQWAQTERTLEGTAAYTRFQLEQFVTGSAVPARSAAVAERLAFEREGVLRQALPIGANRMDVAIYGRVL